MGWIILGIVMQGIGGTILGASLSVFTKEGWYILAIVGFLILLAGFVSFLGGLKKFFLDDIADTLHDIKEKLLLLTIRNDAIRK